MNLTLSLISIIDCQMNPLDLSLSALRNLEESDAAESHNTPELDPSENISLSLDALRAAMFEDSQEEREKTESENVPSFCYL